ncbi:MAG: hypothetical protein ABL888_19475, partial [Pirellulaceae bacterium]
MRLSHFRNNGLALSAALISVAAVFCGGCRVRSKPPVDSGMPLCSDSLQKVYYPQESCDPCDNNSDLLTASPMTLSTFVQTESWDITLDDAIRMALTNSRVLQRLGGVVVSAPQGVSTTFDPAVLATNPQTGVDAAL